MREKGQTEVAKTLETPVFSRGIEILTEKIQFYERAGLQLREKGDTHSLCNLPYSFSQGLFKYAKYLGGTLEETLNPV